MRISHNATASTANPGTHLRIPAHLLSLVARDRANNGILLSLETVGGALDVALRLSGLDLGFTFGVSLHHEKQRISLGVRVRMEETAYLLAIRGELGRFLASADGLVGGFDSGADELFSGADEGVDLDRRMVSDGNGEGRGRGVPGR
jgi:hypothetical protein